MGQTVDATDNFEVNPTILNVVGEVVFSDEFLGDVVEKDAHKVWVVKGCQGRNFVMLKVQNSAPVQKRMLLIISLTSSSGAVLVPTSPR